MSVTETETNEQAEGFGLSCVHGGCDERLRVQAQMFRSTYWDGSPDDFGIQTIEGQWLSSYEATKDEAIFGAELELNKRCDAAHPNRRYVYRTSSSTRVAS